MRRELCLALLLTAGCTHTTSYVHSRTDTQLGRVVVYRNGVAYFERTATVDDDVLRLSVPADKVDDFLRSLTVLDAATGEPTPVSYPTRSALEAGDGLIDMNIGLMGARPHRLKLSYVTESPSWKPSYRLVVGKPGKVEIQGWAIVDNTSGENWKQVKLGVGSSSAMSFRYDLHSIRTVQRETLRSNDLFAQAPPVGGSTYGQAGGAVPVLAELSDSSLAADDEAERARMIPRMAMTEDAEPASVSAEPEHKSELSRRRPSPAPAAAKRQMQAPAEVQAEPKIVAMARRLQSTRDQIIIEGFADRRDADKQAAALARANRVRDQLIRNGLPPERVVAVGKGEQTGRAGGVRLVQAPPPAPPATPGSKDGAAPTAASPQLQDPIGTAHFESTSAMDVPRGSSAMVSILRTEASGDVVYLYDPDSSRGNASFPFKAIRLHNPTDSVLESGPVSVFGEGRFIGEGLVEPIPARSAAFIPFALDRQVVVERKDDERDEIARIITVQRGVFSTEAQHIRKTILTLHNRQDEKACVFVRHTLQPGHKLIRSPSTFERMGLSYLFRVELPAKGKSDVTIEEATPVFKSTDIRLADGMELVRAYLANASTSAALRDKVDGLLGMQKETANVEQQIATTRDQMQEYRNRMDELHAQIVTLTEVKTGAGLLRDLQKKMQDISQKVSQATIQVVNLQEKLMISRIHFQDAVAELSLEDRHPADDAVSESAAAAATAAPVTAAPVAKPVSRPRPISAPLPRKR